MDHRLQDWGGLWRIRQDDGPEEQARLEPLTHGQLHHPFHWALSCSSFNKWNSKRSFQPISALPRMAQDEETPAGPVAKATATLHEP